MAKIIPRWEWRTFGPRFPAAEDALAALTPGRIEESDELYFLGRRPAPTSRSATTSWTSSSSARSTPTGSSGGSRS